MRKILIILCIIFIILLGTNAEGKGCCQCMGKCSDLEDQISCVRYCLNRNDTWINFYEGKDCSEYPACDIGACCEKNPCSQTTRLYCNSYFGGFLKDKNCSECPQVSLVDEKSIDFFEKEYENIIKIPFVSKIFSNERINFYLDGKAIGHLITKNKKIINLGENELQNQTINVYISKETIEEISKKRITFIEALREGKIKYQGVGFFNSLKFKIVAFTFNIYYFFRDLF